MQDDREHLEPPTDPATAVTYELDLNGGLKWGDAMYTVFGYDRSEPADTHEWWAHHIHPDDAMVVNETMDMLMYPWVKEWTVDYRFKKADNRYLLVHDRAVVVRDENGRATTITGIIWPAS